MLRTLLISSLLFSTATLAADKAGDVSEATPMVTRMGEARNASTAMSMWADALAGFYGQALYEGNTDRLSCLAGKESTVRNLVAASESARSELHPAILEGRHAKVERELRKIRIARDRASSLYAEGVECSHLVAQPIEPKPGPAYRSSVSDDIAPAASPRGLDALTAERW